MSPRTNRTERVSAVTVAVVAVAGLTWGGLTLPLQTVIILGIAAVLAYGGWLTWSYRHPVRSRRVIAAYLVAVAFQLIHMAEEYTGGFPHEFVDLFDSPRDWTMRAFLLTFVFGFGALWVLAAAGALYQLRVANFFLWFYALGAGLINAISHFVFPVLAGGYFPGLYTAGGHLLLSALCIWLLVQESRQQRTQSAAPPREAAAEENRVPPRPSNV